VLGPHGSKIVRRPPWGRKNKRRVSGRAPVTAILGRIGQPPRGRQEEGADTGELATDKEKGGT